MGTAFHRGLSFSSLFLALSLLIIDVACTATSGGSQPTKVLTSVSVSPGSAQISAGAVQQFGATAAYSDGSTANVTSTATWAVSSQAVATVSASGLAKGVAPGTTTVIATLDGMKGAAALTVAPPKLASISVLPSSASVIVGATQQFTATASYSNGSTANISATATWNSGNAAVISVSPSGLATGVAAGATTVTASLSGVSGSATLTVNPITVTTIAVTPTGLTILTGATQQFNATATYNDGSTANVTATASWTSATPTVATVNASGIATGVASGSTSIMGSLGGFTGNATVTVSPNVGVDVPLWHFDAFRSGLNSSESFLTTANVNSPGFGKLFSYLVDGYVYGQPVLVSNLSINGGVHNVLYVATENDSVYAFDADTYDTGTPLWNVSLLQSGETPLTTGPILPYTGVTSTPAIDLTTDTMYVVSTQTSSSGSTFRLNALDITTGAQKSGSPVTIQASVAGTNATTLTTSCLQRAALLIANGSVYIGFGACHSGWLLAYSEQTLAQTGVFNASPNLVGEGKYASAGGVWMGGGGPAADNLGNIYVATGNGPWDGQTAWSDSVLKFSSNLTLEDYFTPDAYEYMDCADADLASGGLLLIPGTTPLQAVAGGKIGKLFLVNTTNLGHETTGDTGATDALWFESDLLAPYSASCTDPQGNVWTTDINSYEIFGTAAYFNGSVYLGITPTGTGVPAVVRQFPYSGGLLSQGAYVAPDQVEGTDILEGSQGYTLFISANGASNGIVWLLNHGQPLQSLGTQSNATLVAYDASLTTELYNSNTASNSADVPGYGIKFTSPIVANGKVYISTGHDPVTVSNPQGEIDVYGLSTP